MGWRTSWIRRGVRDGDEGTRADPGGSAPEESGTEEEVPAPRGIAELEHDVVRLDWAERDAYGSLLAAIQEHDSTREAYARWQHARERRLVAEARLDVLDVARRAARRTTR